MPFSNFTTRAPTTPGLPAADYVTDAVWWDLPDELVRSRIMPHELKEATWGVANLCAALVPAIAMVRGGQIISCHISRDNHAILTR